MMDAPPIIVEQVAGGEDLDAVAALEAESFTNPWTREMLSGELAHTSTARVYVARLPGQPVVAFCACWIVAGELHINTLAVAPARRRQGVATALVRQVLADAETAGAMDATLEVRRSNRAALELYARLGFRIEAERPKYYSQPEEDALILWRRQGTGPG